MTPLPVPKVVSYAYEATFGRRKFVTFAYEEVFRRPKLPLLRMEEFPVAENCYSMQRRHFPVTKTRPCAYAGVSRDGKLLLDAKVAFSDDQKLKSL